MYESYISQWKDYLVTTWGLNADFAQRMGSTLLWASVYHISFRINSGFRSDEEQQDLIDRYNRGDKNVFTPAPVGTSLHGNKTWYGKKDSLALDVASNNSPGIAYLGKYYGVVWAGPSDPVHYAARTGPR
jgi:hypothetical protein